MLLTGSVEETIIVGQYLSVKELRKLHKVELESVVVPKTFFWNCLLNYLTVMWLRKK